MAKNVLLYVFLSMFMVSALTGCSETKIPDNPVAQIELTGSMPGSNFLIEVYSHKKIVITSADFIRSKIFKAVEIEKQEEIKLSRSKYNRLMECIDGFFKEDVFGYDIIVCDPTPNYIIGVKRGEKEKVLDDCYFVEVDKKGEYILTDEAQKLLTLLKEISPIPIVFVRGPN